MSLLNLGTDPLLSNYTAPDLLNRYNQSLSQVQLSPIWNEIDRELSTLTEIQIKQLYYNENYVNISAKIQELVAAALLESVKAKIENTPLGKELLTNQLQLLRSLKDEIITSTSKDLEMLQRFKEYSKENPDITYKEFLNKQ